MRFSLFNTDLKKCIPGASPRVTDSSLVFPPPRLRVLQLALAFLAILGAWAPGGETRFYLGTFASESPGIYMGSIDTGTGRLGPLGLAAQAESPNFVALSPDGKFLYAATRNRGGGASAFAAGLAGKLVPLNNQSSGGDDPCHIWVDATGRNVLVANYSGGSIACFKTKTDGSLGKRTALVKYTGSGLDPKRQQKPFAHSVYTDASNRFVYSCDLGTDNIWIFKFDADKGTLTPAEPPSVKVPPGSGPRHLAFHPNGRLVYSANEMGLSVTAFARDPAGGALTVLETVSTLPEDAPTAGATTAEIACHPSGKWLYVSTRGPDTITVFAIAADGKLSRIQNASAHVKTPRGFAIDPAGQWLITAGQDDGKIAVLRIDPATGLLTSTDQTAKATSPVCVLFAPSAASPSQ